MEAIKEITQINYSVMFLWIFAVIFAVKEIIETASYFKKKFKIKTGLDETKETLEERIAVLEKHDKRQYEEISKISNGVESIKNSLELKEKRDNAKTIATLRTQLYDLHEKFMSRGVIDKSGLKTFLELGKIYEEAGGNDIYHEKLKPEIMELQINSEKIEHKGEKEDV